MFLPLSAIFRTYLTQEKTSLTMADKGRNM